MKLHFEPDLDFQLQAIEAVCDLFRGQEVCRSEFTGGEKPIDLICATRPVVIVDEPQSVDGGLKGQGRKALGAMNPLCTLR